MAQITYPDALTKKSWLDKVTPAGDKPTKMGDALADIAGQFAKLPRDLLDIAGLKSADDVKKRIDEIQGKFVKAAQSIVGELKSVEAGAKNAAGTFKKDSKAPKGAEGAANAVAQAAAALKKELEAAPQSAISELKGMLSKLEAQGKKDQAVAAKQAAKDKKEEEGEEADVEEGAGKDPAFRKKVKDWLKSGFNKLKAPEAQPLVCTVGFAGSKPCGFFISKSHGSREKNILKEVAGATKWVKGTAYYVPKEKTYVLEGKALPQGGGNMRLLKEWLKKEMKYSLSEKLRLQKFPGDKDAAVEEGDPDGEVEQQDAADQAQAVVARKSAEAAAANQPAAKTAERGEPANVDADKAWQAKYGALSGKIQAAVKAGGKGGDEVRKRDDELKRLAKQKGVEKQANGLLKEIEAILGKLAELAGARAGGPAAKTTESDAGGTESDGAASSPELEQALRNLATLRSRAEGGVKRLAGLIRDAYAGDAQSDQATKGATRIEQKVSLLSPAIETQIGELLRITDPRQRATKARTVQGSTKSYRERLEKDDLLPDVDGSVFDSSLNVVKPYLAMLQRVEGLLGGLAS
jgi:hypothetical protein